MSEQLLPRTEEEIRALNIQERLELFMGKIPYYATRVQNTTDRLLESVDHDLNQEGLQRVGEDFAVEVGGALTESMSNGMGMDHFFQSGAISEDAYITLKAGAQALGAEMLEGIGQEAFAKKPYENCGRIMAKKLLRKE